MVPLEPTVPGASLPYISVVLAVRNGARTIQRCLDSVLGQEYQRVEVVVMDGASTDGTQAILERYGPAIAYWESRKDRGIYHAWNKALKHVQGQWICFLGADDKLAAPEALGRMAIALDGAAGRFRVAYARIRMVDADGSLVRELGEPWEKVRDGFWMRMTIPHQGTFHHRSLFEVHGNFDERYRICGDYELLLRELLDHDPLFVPDLVVAEMGADGVSSRAGSEAVMRRESHRARYAHGLTTTPEWRAPALIRVRVRDWLASSFGSGVANCATRVYQQTLGRLDRGSRG